MEGKRLLAGRYDVHRATQAIEPDQRADAAPFDRELLAIATIHERHVVDINDSFFSHLPDSFQTNRNPLLRLARKCGSSWDLGSHEYR